VVVYGNVKGNLRAKDRIEIKKDGSVNGDLTTARIMIEDGAYFKGSIEIDKSSEKESVRTRLPGVRRARPQRPLRRSNLSLFQAVSSRRPDSIGALLFYQLSNLYSVFLNLTTKDSGVLCARDPSGAARQPRSHLPGRLMPAALRGSLWGRSMGRYVMASRCSFFFSRWGVPVAGVALRPSLNRLLPLR